MAFNDLVKVSNDQLISRDVARVECLMGQALSNEVFTSMVLMALEWGGGGGGQLPPLATPLPISELILLLVFTATCYPHWLCGLTFDDYTYLMITYILTSIVKNLIKAKLFCLYL